MSFIKDYPQSSDEVASFIKLPVILKFYFHCLENLKAPVVSFNATRLKENLLEINANLKATQRKKEIFISFKDGLPASLKYSREHSLQSNATNLSRIPYIIRNKILKKL